MDFSPTRFRCIACGFLTDHAVNSMEEFAQVVSVHEATCEVRKQANAAYRAKIAAEVRSEMEAETAALVEALALKMNEMQAEIDRLRAQGGRTALEVLIAERDQLAAKKLAEADRALCERAEQVDKLMQERDLVMARLGNFCQPGEIEDRIRILQGHAGKMERQRDEARADAERLRGELDAERESHAETHDLAYEATRTAAPTVAVTDVEKAAEEMCAANYPGGIDSDNALAILRKHTRAASVEEVAKAFHRGECDSEHSASEATGVPWENANQPLYRDGARAALRALGVREAEKPLTIEEEDEIARMVSRDISKKR